MMRRCLTALALVLLAGDASVHAETLLTGFGGVALGGATERNRATYGASLGFLSHGILGFEAEFATTPEFFGSAQANVFTDNNVVTLMGSLLVAAPAGPVRLYGAAGAGLFKTRLADRDRLFSIDSNDFGINVGGGVLISPSAHIGLRADVRYFRDLKDSNPDGLFDLSLGHVDYWRVVGGVTLKF
jgi:opacity protein-like surface antigen